jgi:hypothetical protein
MDGWLINTTKCLFLKVPLSMIPFLAEITNGIFHTLLSKCSFPDILTLPKEIWNSQLTARTDIHVNGKLQLKESDNYSKNIEEFIKYIIQSSPELKFYLFVSMSILCCLAFYEMNYSVSS